MAKKTYSQKQVDIINVLADNPDGLTIAQMSEILGAKVQPGTVTGLVRAGLVTPVGVVQVKRPTKDQVSTYAVANADFIEDKKYSDSEKKILAAARTLEAPFTLAQLAEATGIARVTAGHINGLMKAGNLCMTDVKIDVVRYVAVEHNLYVKCGDIPADAEIRGQEIDWSEVSVRFGRIHFNAQPSRGAHCRGVLEYGLKINPIYPNYLLTKQKK